MQTNANIDELDACLETVAKRPDRFRIIVPTGHEFAYMSGIGVGMRFLLGIANDARQEHRLREKAAVARGWRGDRHPYEQMKERDLTADEVLTELLRLEIEFISQATRYSEQQPITDQDANDGDVHST
jgi:hypothetical protein